MFGRAFGALAAVVAGKAIGAGLEAGYEKFVAPNLGTTGNKVAGFLGDLGLTKETFFGTVENVSEEVLAARTDLSDLPSVGQLNIPTTGGNTAGVFRPGQTPTTFPLGNGGQVGNALARHKVLSQIRQVGNITTVSAPKATVVNPNIAIGSSQIKKIKKAKG